MVWGVFPVDPLSGEDKYYIFTRGTFKVGRKGCDIIINKDKGVSRIHAEIVVDEMISLNPLQKNSSLITSKVRIIDCSKYGTVINRDCETRKKLHELPNKETTLKDGDLISFGTGSATYRFCYVPFLLFACCSDVIQVNASVQDKVSSIGACLTNNFCQECTHVLIHRHMPVNEDFLDVIVAKKPLVVDSWLESLAEKSIRTEFPSCSLDLLNLEITLDPSTLNVNGYSTIKTAVEGVSVELANFEAREKSLRGYTFLLESTCEYKFGFRLQSLLELCGAKTLSIENFCSSSQDLEYVEHGRVICVIPRRSEDNSNCFNKLSSLSRVDEVTLVCAVLSGHLNPSILISPSVVISSSCSTDETVVADSDVEAETSSVVHARAVDRSEEAPKYLRKDEVSTDSATNRIEDGQGAGFRDVNNRMTASREKTNEFESESSDILYSQDIVVRSLNLPATMNSTSSNGVLNFKRFRKINTQSGNSFSSLIPFSKYPYKDSDCGTEGMVECVKEEKKRKQMEAMAEDLFNNEKGRKRGIAGSIHGLLTRG